MNIKDMIEEKISLMKNMISSCDKEKRTFTSEEQEKFDALFNECESLKKELEMRDKFSLLDKSFKQDDPIDNDHKDKNKATSEPADSSSAVSIGKDLKNQKPMASLGDVLSTVILARSTNNSTSSNAIERLNNLGLNTETGAEGGFLIPKQFVAALIQQAEEESVLWSKTNKINMTVGNSVEIPRVENESRAAGNLYGGITTQWVPENGTVNFSQPKFDNLSLRLSKIMSLVRITSEMIEDSSYLESWIRMAFPAVMSFELDQAVFNGDGVGKPLGILNSGAVVTVPKESSQLAGTIVAQNIVKMLSHLNIRSRKSAAWYITQEAEAQLPLMTIGNQPVYVPPGGLSGKGFGTLLGYPVIVCEHNLALGTKGDLLLADVSDYLTITKGGIRSDSSIHVEFISDRSVLRFVQRAIGAPYTKTATESRAKSSFKTSPYVVLADRS